jgi:hypothetical protein
MSDKAPIEIVTGAEFATPSDRPIFGEKRLVRYLPVPLPGMNGMLMPCIWMSDYVEMDADLNENVKVCLVLLGKGPPRPDVICVRIPATAVDKFPMGPVEW